MAEISASKLKRDHYNSHHFSTKFILNKIIFGTILDKSGEVSVQPNLFFNFATSGQFFLLKLLEKGLSTVKQYEE